MGLLRPLLFVLFLPVGLAFGDEGTLAFETFGGYPPLSYAEHGEPKGYYVDLTRAVAQKLARPYVLTVKDWGLFLQDLKAAKPGVYTAVTSSLGPDAPVERTLPLTMSDYTLFSRGQPGLSGLSDLVGLRVGVIAGGLPASLIALLPGVTTVAFNSVQDGFSALENGTVDAFAAAKTVGNYLLGLGAWPKVTALPDAIAVLPVALGVPKDDPALLGDLNRVIRELRADGTFASIESRWFPKAGLRLNWDKIAGIAAPVLGALVVLLVLWIFFLVRGIRRRRVVDTECNLLRVALDQAKWGVAITNEAGTAPVYLNTEFARMHGYETGELLGRPWRDLLDEKDRPNYKHAIEATLKNGTYTTEMGRVRKDGSKFPAMTTATVIADPNGKMQGIVVNLLDISDRKRAEAELVRAQKLESVGLLAAGIAHDFNNILAALRGQFDLASIFLRQRQLEKAGERLGKAPILFDRAKVLTSRLVTFAKGGSPVRSMVALGNHLKDWVELALAGSDVTSIVGVEPDLRTCSCDPGQIGQVIHNLVLNARQASPPRGMISVWAENRDFNGSFVAISVKDEGLGISKDVLPSLFEPFFTTRQGGSGLGLSMAYSVVKQHSGWIDVVSEEGKGSTFTVFLPSSPDAPRPADDGSFPAIEMSGTAVVMDDDESVGESVGEMLRLVGLDVVDARDGQEALEHRTRLLAAGKRVTLYVLDLTVPDRMSGLETAENLRRDGDTAPVLFMSGYSEDVLRLTAGQFRGAHWLPKPFTNAELCLALGKLESVV
jgi:PAS domain S-box-containing protein